MPRGAFSYIPLFPAISHCYHRYQQHRLMALFVKRRPAVNPSNLAVDKSPFSRFRRRSCSWRCLRSGKRLLDLVSLLTRLVSDGPCGRELEVAV
jgi:hypothetical protein